MNALCRLTQRCIQFINDITVEYGLKIGAEAMSGYAIHHPVVDENLERHIATGLDGSVLEA